MNTEARSPDITLCHRVTIHKDTDMHRHTRTHTQKSLGTGRDLAICDLETATANPQSSNESFIINCIFCLLFKSNLHISHHCMSFYLLFTLFILPYFFKVV